MGQENLQAKGFFGILGFSIRLIHSRRRLFLALAAFSLLPLAALSMGSIPIANRIFEYSSDTGLYSYRYRRATTASAAFVIVYGLIYIFSSLFNVGAAIHASASVYTAKDAATVNRSLRAALRTWPRLLGTSFWALVMTVVYILVGAIILVITVVLARLAVDATVVLRVLAIIFVVVVAVLFIVGVIYVSVLWNLAVAATVLEAGTGSAGGGSSCWGIAAIRKARTLVRGRLFVCGALQVIFEVLIFAVQDICWRLALYAHGISLGGRIVLGAGILFALTGIFLLGITVLTVTYLVLKAWHGEPVDPVSLAARLDACTGEYDRMVAPNGAGYDRGHDNVQMMHQRV